VKNQCAESAHSGLISTELKLVEIVKKLSEEISSMKEAHNIMGEQVEEMREELEGKIDVLGRRVGVLESMHMDGERKSEMIIQAIQLVEAKTTDSSYIQSFVQKQYDELKNKLKNELRRELDEEHEKSVTALEVNRHIDHARLDGKCAQLSERLEQLRETVVSEQTSLLNDLQNLVISAGAAAS